MTRWTPKKLRALRNKLAKVRGCPETQALFAARLGVSRHTYREWETTGRYEPNVTTELLLDRFAQDIDAGRVPPVPPSRKKRPALATA